MTKYVVKWIVEGEMAVEADSTQDAERKAQEMLVASITNPDKWPQELGTTGIQGAAEELSS
jgi:hypothetical protein